jgi:hypothetical protein
MAEGALAIRELASEAKIAAGYVAPHLDQRELEVQRPSTAAG